MKSFALLSIFSVCVIGSVGCSSQDNGQTYDLLVRVQVTDQNSKPVTGLSGGTVCDIRTTYNFKPDNSYNEVVSPPTCALLPATDSNGVGLLMINLSAVTETPDRTSEDSVTFEVNNQTYSGKMVTKNVPTYDGQAADALITVQITR